jgi:transmembrane sensor
MDWLLRLEAAPDDVQLRAAFDAWLQQSDAHRDAFRVVGHTWERLGALPRQRLPERKAVAVATRQASMVKRYVRTAVAIAAAAAMACLMFAFFPTLQTRLLADHATGVAELRQVVLEDGSIVHLDAGSAIDLKYGGAGREIALLAGQAFFEVVSAQGRPFRVRAGDVTVTVRGTAFSVGKSSETISVAVQSGTVEVSPGDGKPAAMLTREQRLVVDRASRSITRSEVAQDEIASWRRHRLVVHDATFGEVVEELQRHHAGLIVLSDRTLGRRLVTGVFDLTRPVEALTVVAETQNARLTTITPYLLVISAR